MGLSLAVNDEVRVPFTRRISAEVDSLIKAKPVIVPLVNLPIDIARSLVDDSRKQMNEVADGIQFLLKKKRAGNYSGILPKASSLVNPVEKAGSKLESGFFSPVVAGASRSARSNSMGFSPFVINLWSKKGGGLLGRSQAFDGLQDATIPVGRYQFRFNIPKTAIIPFVETTRHIPIKIKGKAAVIEAAKIDNAAGKMRVQVEIQQNPIPIIAAVIAIGASLGVGGWGLSSALDSVDKVVVDTSNNLWKIGLSVAGTYIVLKWVGVL